MKVLTAPLWELAEFEEGKALLDRGKGHVAFSGLYDSQKLHMVYGLSDGFTQKIIVTFSDKRAREIGAEYGFYDRRTMVYPGKDLIFYQADVSGGDLVRERMRVLRALLEKRPVTIVTTMSALMMPQTPLSGIVSRILHFDKKSTVDERKLSAQLVEMGYEKCPQVEEPGQFSIRGGIIDIFDMTEENPYRIELWGDSVESIRSFDVLSQRSVENLDEIAIYPATELMLSEARRQDGKQVVFLVPTTILAQQHYNTFVQRMKDYPIRIEQMSRFRTPAQQKKVIEDLKKGLVDIVIGTHRVLSSDMQYKDLGLLMIDEEQRFGVTHKEKIKKMKENVDVLTLTATPIPRTLHMSLVGIRDMSVLEEAPEERQPIQTYVMEYNEEMVREAITRELSRNGQVYYVYNRVNTIADMAARIGEMVPDANVAFAHGQMSERELEKIMFSFINGEIDILVATTIIETGLDISNVNTIIIHDSDRMGLSQLYQLRGRVGRSNRTAYAFLMYKRDKVLREIAEKRLAAIREFTDLGSGFKIAMKDLEIRGAGNLLGERQHGHMEAVGYDLYCKMLNEAVKNLKGEDTAPDFLTTVELEVDAYIPASYIVNEQQKLDIYKRIAGVETESESAEMKEELLDRFGTVPKSVDNLLRIALLRAQAHKLYIMEIKGRPGELRFVYRPDARVHGENIPMLFEQYGNSLKFLPQGNPVFTYQFKRSNGVEKNSEDLLSQAEQMIKDMQRCLL